MQHDYDKGHAAGASSSLEKTIKEVERLFRRFAAKSEPATGSLREDLHEILETEVSRFARFWFTEGFRLAHSEIHGRCPEAPATLEADVELYGIPGFTKKYRRKVVTVTSSAEGTRTLRLRGARTKKKTKSRTTRALRATK